MHTVNRWIPHLVINSVYLYSTFTFWMKTLITLPTATGSMRDEDRLICVACIFTIAVPEESSVRYHRYVLPFRHQILLGIPYYKRKLWINQDTGLSSSLCLQFLFLPDILCHQRCSILMGHHWMILMVDFNFILEIFWPSSTLAQCHALLEPTFPCRNHEKASESGKELCFWQPCKTGNKHSIGHNQF